jgi:hypothetical protein
MSHFTVLVVGDDYEKALEPFQENNMGDCPKELLKWYGYNKNHDRKFFDTKAEAQAYASNKKEVYQENPNAKWDWYSLGGRWSGFFKLKPGATGETGRPGVFGNQAESGSVDQCRVKDIDIAGMRDEAGKKAAEQFDQLKRLMGGSIPKIKKSWKAHIDEGFNETTRDRYWSQAALVKLNQVRKSEGLSKADRDFLTWVDLEKYQMPRETYIERARNGAIGTFALLKDGQWYERGEMGWWGAVGNEKDESRWQEEFSKLFDTLDPDTIVSVVDCHI